ncbi:MAG: phosphate ABC transporter substrate-binding protein PstS family protein, partial [Leptolinea sp.]
GKDVKTPIFEKAILQQSNGQIRTTLATTENSIGYLSFGFLDNSVKALKFEGVDPTVANVKNKTYKVSRPLNMLTKGDPKPLAKSFIDYILSDAGQKVVVTEGYISIKEETQAQSAPAASALSGQLQLAGSTTVQPLAEKLAAEFTKANTGVKIDIQGGGTSVGITSAGDGTVEIGNASRALKDEEKKKYPDLKEITIAFDGIAVVVNPNVKLDGLTRDQIRDIFSGKVTNFKDVGGPDAPITIVSREEGSGTRTAFEDLVMLAKDANGKDVKTPIFEKAILQQSNGQIRTTIATTENSIGYLSFGFLDSSIKALKFDGIEPTVANVKNNTYKVSRPLNMLTKGDPKPLAKAFIDYILSDEGQKLVVAEGYMTVK